MKTEFLQPLFDGPRFDEHTLPVEVARDLAAYEELVIELAKHLYLQRHKARQRVPRGFEKQFSLHIERVDDGSAKPLLSWVAAAGLLLPGGKHAPYFDDARDVIAACVQASAENRALPEDFPPHLLEYFNVLGRSLREGESVDLSRAGAPAPAVLNPERRKKLVLAAQKTYLKEVDLSGLIGEVDWEKQTFRLRLDDNATTSAPFTPAIEARVRKAAGVPRTRVFLRGVGVYDAYDKLQKMSATEHLDMTENHALAVQFEALSDVKDGWMDGAGEAPVPANLERLADQLTCTFPADVMYPFVCLTPSGGVFLEWTLGEWMVSAEFVFAESRCELQAVNTTSSEIIDEEQDMRDTEDLTVVYEFVRRFA